MVSLGTQPANRKSGFGHSSPTGARAQDLTRQPARPDLWGARVSNDPGLPDPATPSLKDARIGLMRGALTGWPASRNLRTRHHGAWDPRRSSAAGHCRTSRRPFGESA